MNHTVLNRRIQIAVLTVLALAWTSAELLAGVPEPSSGEPTAPGPLRPGDTYGAQGYWDGVSQPPECVDPSTQEQRICAEWFDAAFPDLYTICCVDSEDLSDNAFRDCDVVLETGVRGPGQVAYF